MNRTRKILSELRFKHYLTATFVSLLLLIPQTESTAQSDTVDVGRQYDLDTIKFLNTYQKNVSLLHSDTLFVQIEGKYYRIPYKVTLRSVDVADNTPKRFAISSLALRIIPTSAEGSRIFLTIRERDCTPTIRRRIGASVKSMTDTSVSMMRTVQLLFQNRPMKAFLEMRPPASHQY